MLHFGVTTLGTHARCLLEGFIRDGYSGCTCTDQVKCKPADEYLQWWKAYTSDASIHAEIQEAESFVREAGKNFEEGGSGLDYDLIIPSPEDPSSEITILWQRTYYGISPKISSHLSSLYLHLFMLKKPGDAAAYAPYYIDKLKARFLKKGTIVQYGINGRLLFIVSGYDYIAIQDILLLFSESPPDQQKIDACIENLSNSDIRWDGTFSGLFPVVEGEVAKQLFSFGSYPTPALIAALDDPEKFVAAHVLLTLIHYKQFSTSASQWNGLTVELHANGDVVIDPGQIPTIKAMWEKEMFKASDSDESRSQQ
jgi:hypothetical protein